MNSNAIKEDSGFIKLFRIVTAYRKKLIIINATVFVLITIISFLLSHWYKGSVTIIVNDNVSNSLTSSMIGGDLPIDLFGGFTNNKIYQYMNFVKSRRILDEIDSLYSLQEIYETEYRKMFYEDLKANMDIVDNEDNTFTIDFYYEEDPVKAAQIANSIYDLLFGLSLELSRERSKELRLFLEESYTITLKKLEDAEVRMTNFQVDNQIYDVKVQIEMLIGKIAELEIEKIQTEIEYKFLSKSLNKSNEKLRALNSKIQVISQKIEELKFNDSKNNFSLSSIPVRAIEYLKLYRETQILYRVLEFIVPQLENARLQEINNNADIQLLDKAVPEDYKSKPKRIAIIFTVTFLSLIISLFIIILHDYYSKNKEVLNEILGKS